MPWSHADTRRYLDEFPLPVDFLWPHSGGGERPVMPTHRQVTGYGKWLQETPYFQGLFEIIHLILARADALGDSAWLAVEVDKFRPRGTQPELL